MFQRSILLTMVGGVLWFVAPAWAGPIFLTGHDPDFHSQEPPNEQREGAQKLLRIGLDFVTEGTFDREDELKFLWVESTIAPPRGHRRGEESLALLGLQRGTHYELATAEELEAVDFSQYTAIVIASSFGGLLTRAELDALIDRREDIEEFINNGGGLLALAEGAAPPPREELLVGLSPPKLFGFLPASLVANPSAPIPPFKVTPFGESLGLTDKDVARAPDKTHNWFDLTAGFQIVEVDAEERPVTLAGEATIEAKDIFVIP